MTKGKLSKRSDFQQQIIEGALCGLGVAIALLDLDQVRIKQAIKRTGLKDLLLPVLDDHQQIKDSIHSMQNTLREVWNNGQNNRWKDTQESNSDQPGD